MMTSARPSLDLTGRRALVTGSTRGIGAAIAAGLARAGATVVVHGRTEESVLPATEELRNCLGADGLEAHVHASAFDVGDHDALLAAAADIDATLGGLDVLVNNAGIQRRAPIVDMPIETWDAVFGANVTSAFRLAQHFAPGMIARGYGKVINVCSVQNQLVRATTAPYAASKAALGSLTRTMCAEWASLGIQANGLAPGYIDTDLNQSLVADETFNSWVTNRTPARRWGHVEDVVGPAVWLASSASDFVNGQLIYVDGGLTAVL
jgi:gluconate 5-dehydrogenase